MKNFGLTNNFVETFYSYIPVMESRPHYTYKVLHSSYISIVLLESPCQT